MIQAVCIGEAMIELSPAGPSLYARAIAGDAYNAAVYLARSLGAAGHVAFLTALGYDSLSDEIASDIVGRGLDDRFAFRVPGAMPGLYLIELDDHNDRSFHYWRSASAARQWYVELQARGGEERLAGRDLVYLSGISLAILSPEDRRGALRLLAALKGRVGRIAFDPNVRPRLWPDLATARAAVETACALADIVLPSDADAALLWGERDPERQLALYQALGASEIALTAGSEGAWLRTAAGDLRLSAPSAKVIDTSGAGDSFNGGYLAARLTGAEPEAAAKAGLDVAARTVGARGALVPVEISHPLDGHIP